MSRTSSSNDSNNSEDFGEKYYRKIDPFSAPYLQSTPLSQVDVTNDKDWEEWNSHTSTLANTMINKLKNQGGVVVSEDIRRNLHDFHGVRNQEVANNTIHKIVADPRTIAFTDPNRKNSYYITH